MKRRAQPITSPSDLTRYGFGTCGVEGCGTKTSTGQLMCGPHWRRCPSAHRVKVIRNYSRWQDGNLPLSDLRTIQEAACRAAGEAEPAGVDRV